jgi:DNA-binding PadR family transcriptional regulator
MQEATFLIMTSLASEARHGYGIILDVELLTSGHTKMRPGTLYASLDRLRSDQLVQVDRIVIHNNRVRRFYVLTDAGKQVLEATAAERNAVTKVALHRLNASVGLA